MSDPVTPLAGARADGIATVREIGPQGMILLRAAAETPRLAEAIAAATGAVPPPQRCIRHAGDRAAAWMSPDEYLLLLPRAAVAGALSAIAAALGPAHHLAADVSDARAVFRVEGPRAAEVLARLCPVDFARLAADEIRRTRLAQVACALWPQDGGYTLVTFRSVARYAFDVLANAAA
jgi:sarcosine oxidase subunit gamma